FAFKLLSKHGERNIGRFSAGRLTAYAIDDDEKTAGRVTVEPILVDRALAACVGLASSYKCVDGSHVFCRRVFSCINKIRAVTDRAYSTSVLILNFSPNVTRYDDSQSGKQNEPRPQQQRHERTRLKLRYTVSARPMRA